MGRYVICNNCPCLDVAINRGSAYDVDYRNPRLGSKKSDISYDPAPVENAMFRKWIYGSSMCSIVLNTSLSYGITRLFNFFVLRGVWVWVGVCVQNNISCNCSLLSLLNPKNPTYQLISQFSKYLDKRFHHHLHIPHIAWVSATLPLPSGWIQALPHTYTCITHIGKIDEMDTVFISF